MKDTDRPEKSSGEVARKPGGQTVSPVRPAKRTPARGEVRRAAKKVVTPREEQERVSPDPGMELPAPNMTLAQHDVSRLAGSLDLNLDPNTESFDQDDTNDLPGGDLTLQEPAPGEYLLLSTSSYFETLSEHFADEEAEAAMLEADLAMCTDECALVCEEGLELVEPEQEEVSARMDKT